METCYVITTNELYHHGILGQKWGVRRYQNPDGTLTDAGKKKYRKQYDNLVNRRQNFDRQEKYYNERSHKTGINSIDKRIEKIHNKNNDIYKKKYNKDLKKLVDKIGEKGLSDLDKDVLNEGKKRYKESMDRLKKINESVEKDKKKHPNIDPDIDLFKYTPEMMNNISESLRDNYVKRKLLNRRNL